MRVKICGDEVLYCAKQSTKFFAPDRKPILVMSKDFWMPLSRARKLRDWLDEAIRECEREKRRGR